MHVTFMVICEHASRLMSGGPVLVGVIRGIQVPSFPAVIEPFYIALEIECDPHESGRHEFLLRMMDEDGGVYFENSIEVDFERRPNLLPSYTYFASPMAPDRPLPNPGVYRFDLLWREIVLAQARVEVLPRATGS